MSPPSVSPPSLPSLPSVSLPSESRQPARFDALGSAKEQATEVPRRQRRNRRSRRQTRVAEHHGANDRENAHATRAKEPTGARGACRLQREHSSDGVCLQREHSSYGVCLQRKQLVWVSRPSHSAVPWPHGDTVGLLGKLSLQTSRLCFCVYYHQPPQSDTELPRMNSVLVTRLHGQTNTQISRVTKHMSRTLAVSCH